MVLLGFTSRLGANWCTGINISSLFQFISYTHIQHSCSRRTRSGRRLSGYIYTFLVALLVLYREDKNKTITGKYKYIYIYIHIYIYFYINDTYMHPYTYINYILTYSTAARAPRSTAINLHNKQTDRWNSVGNN